MARPDDEAQLQKFLDTLRGFGGTAGNSRMFEELGWSENEYWRLRDKLLEAGLVVRGRGRGGSVSLVPEVPPALSSPLVVGTAIPSVIEAAQESALYEPCKKVLEEHWARERGLQDFHIEITAAQGRKATGGVWTRPDITALSLRTFKHWPGRFFDIWTFEAAALG